MVIRAVLIVALVLLGARILVTGVADHYAKSDPERALAWRGNQPEALVNAATLRRKAGDVQRAADYARRAIAANPLDGRGYRELALATADASGIATTRALMQVAVHRAPRDLVTRDWLMRDALAQGQYGVALGHVDSMLRVDPPLGKALFPALATAVSEPAPRAALIDVLATDPPWRAAFWNRLCRDGTDSAGIAQVVEALRASKAPLDEREQHAWIERLIREHRWASAYPAWVDTLDLAQRARIGNVFDGDFAWPPSNSGFGWRIDRVPGAEADFRGQPGQRYLHLRFANRRVPFRHVSQLLALAPGSYEFSGRLRMDALHNDRGVQWTITCAEGQGARIGETTRWSGSSPWRSFTTRLTVPETGCGAQWLRLVLAARIPAESQASGQIDFANLRIDQIRD
jgi:tetratricopeptide (TPR) repeat protein